MDIQLYRDEIKLALTGGVLELELDDATIDKIINSALVEVQRYIDTSKFETISYSKCIDLSPRKIHSVVGVYRTEGYNTSDSSTSDPMYTSQWMITSGYGGTINSNYLLNYAAWATTSQIRNTISTDLTFIYDKMANKLYINTSSGTPSKVTIEYIPIYSDVSEITSDFWTDILMRLSIGRAKQAVGRIRTRYTQSSALWTQDGATLLEEGNNEVTAVREAMLNAQMEEPLD